jgi:hypothetical protein
LLKLEVCDDPIFVVGAPRSGTSMLQWALRQHPNLWGGQESDYLIPLHERLRELHEYGSHRGRLHWLSGQQVSFSEFARSVGLGVSALYTDRAGGRRWVEQTPEYTLYLDAMAELFPGAVFLFMVRDGRQVVASLRNFVNPVDHEQACRTWVRFMNSGLAFAGSARGAKLRAVRYESVVANTEAALRDVFTFVGEDFARESVEFVKTERINSSFGSHADPLRPRWTAWSHDERRVFDEIAGPMLVELDYAKDSSWVLAEPVTGGDGVTRGSDVDRSR